MKLLHPWMRWGALAIGLVFAAPSFAQLVNGQSAVGVLGPSDLVTRATAAVTASRFNGPNGVALDRVTGKLFVADRANHRVLRWASADAMNNGSAAEAVLGQPDFVTGTSGLSAVKMNNPIGVHVDAAGRLWVGDFGNNRVLRFDGASAKATGSAADAVLGQPDFVTNSGATTALKMNGPVGLCIDAAGRLWVSNFSNHRVLRYDDAANKPNGAAADAVLGQPDFTTATSGLSAVKMNNPNSVCIDASGRLYVSDFTNRRVLRFDDAANKPNGGAADAVLGQPDFTSNLGGVSQVKFSTTRFVAVDAFGRLYVVEETNNRVMVFNNAGTLANGAPADVVLGQATFTTNAGPNPPTAASLATPRALEVDNVNGRLWLADWANNRVIRYEAALDPTPTLALVAPNGGEQWTLGSTRTIQWASGYVANVSIDYSTDNGATWLPVVASTPGAAHAYTWTVPNTATRDARVRVRDASNAALQSVSASRFALYDDGLWVLSSGQSAVGVLGPADLVTRPTAAVTASRFNGPNGVALDRATGKLFVADRANHRVLRWASADAMNNGSAAEAVLGQPDFVTGTSGLSAVKMNNPIGVHVDAAGRLWVGDYGNNRVLRFDDASAKATGSAADAVLGQPDFVTNTSATTAVKMSGPVGLCIDAAGRLWVSNFGNHRVLRFDDAANKANGAAADAVLGQPDFTTGTSGLSAVKMNNPNSVCIDASGRLYVSDYTNRRVLRFDDAANKPNGGAADAVLGQPDFATNSAGVTQSKFSTTRFVAVDAFGRLYVVEEANNRVMVFANAGTLANGAPADVVLGQATFATNAGPNPPTAASLATPRALEVDNLMGRLWLADWANNRVIRYEVGHVGTPTLTLSAPNGGEDWPIGLVRTIAWTSANLAAVNLEYSTDAGATWLPIATSVPASPPSYAWTIPNAPTTQALVRVSDAANAALNDVSAAPFTISVPVSTLSLVSPNGLQQWEAGVPKKILFNAGNVDNVRIELSTNGGSSWSDITASAPAASGSYTWTVPASVGNACRVRVTNTANPLVTDASDANFAIVPERTGDEFDAVFFSDSPTAVYYDPSFTAVTSPSLLERANTDKCPVTTTYSLVGNYSLKLAWTSAAGGDWMMANAGLGWVGRDVTDKDSLIFNVFTETATPAASLPCIYVEDLGNQKSTKLPLSGLMSDVPAGAWTRVAIPMQVFKDNPGAADLTRIKTIFLGQQTADGVARVWYLDDFRMTGGTPVTGDSTKLIVILGSSTSAGTGASTADSMWVNRYRKYLRSMDSSVVVVNLAIGGYTTYHVMPTGYVPPVGRPSPSPNNNITFGLAYKPWAIIVNLPSNDAASGYPIPEQLANYDTLKARATAVGVPIWFTSTQPRNFTDALQRDQLRIMRDSTMARYSPYAIDLYTGLSAPDGTILPQYGFGDGIHLNDAGHRYVYERVVGANVWAQIDPTVEITRPDGGEALMLGTPDTLRWNATNTSHVSGYELYLSRTGIAGPWAPIASVGAGATWYAWTVPGPVVPDSCFVRVVATGTAGALASDRSDAGFSIVDPATAVLLSFFVAEPVADGVQLRWEFGATSDLGPAHAYRSSNEGGPWVELGDVPRQDGEAWVVVDRDAPEGQASWYRLVVTTGVGQQTAFGPVSATPRPRITEFALALPAPNPTDGPARIRFAVPVTARVEVTVHDVQGRVVERLAHGTVAPGEYAVTFNDDGRANAGLYFVRFSTPKKEFTRRFTVVR